mgnify:CR=1 FL=1
MLVVVWILIIVNSLLVAWQVLSHILLRLMETIRLDKLKSTVQTAQSGNIALAGSKGVNMAGSGKESVIVN